MWLRSRVTSATFILALIASIEPCFSISLLTNPQQMYKRNSVGHLNYGVRSTRTSGAAEGRFFSIDSIGRLGSYFTKMYSYFESGMNLFWGSDGHTDDASSNKVNYKRYQLVRVIPRTDMQVDDVLALKEEIEGLMYWTQPAKNNSADILIPPELVTDVKEFLQLRELEFVVLLKDVQVSRK